LYAISAAARGNIDIQQALVQSNLNFISIIKSIVIQINSNNNNNRLKHNSTEQKMVEGISSFDKGPIEIERKIWSFIYDMLEESLYSQTGKKEKKKEKNMFYKEY
jgi:hypothetical protein